MTKSKSIKVKVDTENKLVIDDKNRLKKFVLDGRWSLTPENNLKLHVLASRSEFSGKTLVLKGDIESVTGKSLSFRVRECRLFSGLRSGTVQLKGIWRVDRYNRITFNAAKARGRYDTLTFQGAWQVNKQNEVIYRYFRKDLKTRKKKTRTLIFKGWWDLGKDRIVYRLDRATDSFFGIKAALQSRSLLAAEGEIKYQVGIKYLERKVYRRVTKTITIYGTWKLSRDLNAKFEVKYSLGKVKEMSFLAEKVIAEGSNVTLSLNKKTGEKLGFSVMFTKTIKF